jgi:tRNA dimethylallyltransferase
VGATASGKSAVAMEVAHQLGDVHLVAVDSMQVYRRMDIGTAKPSVAERAGVPHHCIDLVEPCDDFTVAEFQAAHHRALVTIADSGVARALLVGGTGLYHRVVIDDFDLPGEWPEVRAELESTVATTALFERLATLDPMAAAKIEPGNRRRIVRALEVTLGSGRPFSTFGPGVDNYPPTPVLQIGLRWPREVQATRIADRVGQMIDAGLVGEVSAIAENPGFSRTAAQALGYKEILAHLDGRISQDEAIAMTITRTRQFAVRQERWFRRDPRIRWFDVEHDPVNEAVPAVIAAFGSLRAQ